MWLGSVWVGVMRIGRQRVGRVWLMRFLGRRDGFILRSFLHWRTVSIFPFMKTLFPTATMAILFFSCGSFAAALVGAANEPKIGEHFKVVPAANGTGEITLVANGLNFQDTNGNWIASVPVVQRFSGGILCTGASYRAILATNLNSYGSVDVELPAGSATNAQGRIVSHPLGVGETDRKSTR